MIDRLKNFLLSDYFPIVIACILFITSGLDIGMTNHVHRTNPELFYRYEGALLARMFFVTDMWWVCYLAYSLRSIGILLLSTWYPRNKHAVYVIRISCFILAILPILWVLSWVNTLNNPNAPLYGELHLQESWKILQVIGLKPNKASRHLHPPQPGSVPFAGHFPEIHNVVPFRVMGFFLTFTIVCCLGAI